MTCIGLMPFSLKKNEGKSKIWIQWWTKNTTNQVKNLNNHGQENVHRDILLLYGMLLLIICFIKQTRNKVLDNNYMKDGRMQLKHKIKAR